MLLKILSGKCSRVVYALLSFTLFTTFLKLWTEDAKSLEEYTEDVKKLEEDHIQNHRCLKRSKNQRHSFYSHVTKAGGTSVNLLLRQEAVRRGEQFEDNSRVLYKKTGEYKKVQVVKILQERTLWSSELPYKNFARVLAGGDWFKFVILRKPIDRFNSYRQMRANTKKDIFNHYRSERTADKMELIDTHKNSQCRHVSVHESSCTESALKSWDLVLIFEDFDISVAMICIFLNISSADCCLPMVNVRKVQSYPLPKLTTAEIKYFEKMNSREILVYEAAKERFEFERKCNFYKINSYLSGMQTCKDASGVRVNKGSE